MRAEQPQLDIMQTIPGNSSIKSANQRKMARLEEARKRKLDSIHQLVQSAEKVVQLQDSFSLAVNDRASTSLTTSAPLTVKEPIQKIKTSELR